MKQYEILDGLPILTNGKVFAMLEEGTGLWAIGCYFDTGGHQIEEGITATLPNDAINLALEYYT